MKSARFNRLLASTALGLVLVLGSHAGMAQQSDKEIEAAVPMPDTTLPPPLTANDVASSPSAAPADVTKAEPAKPQPDEGRKRAVPPRLRPPRRTARSPTSCAT